MKSYGRKAKPSAAHLFLLTIIFVLLVLLVFLSYNDGLVLGVYAQNTSAGSNGSFSPSQVESVGMAERQPTWANDSFIIIAKCLRGLRQFMYNMFSDGIRFLCFVWLSIYAYIYFHKKTIKKLSILSLPIGGNAPPLAAVSLRASRLFIV